MRAYTIELLVDSKTGSRQRSIEVGSVSGARFSSRDTQGMRRELDEMIARDGHYTGATRTNPSIFRIGRYLLTQDDEFEVQGTLTGCEAEVVAIRAGNDIWISVGSDQCDRELDDLFPDKPKQMCPHPIASVAWPYDEVKDHWDQLRISSEVEVQGHTVAIQDTTIDTQVDLEYLLAMDTVKALPEPMVLYCGAAPFLTESISEAIQKHDLPAATEHGTGERTFLRLHDPVLGRTIEHQFRAVPLGDELPERSLIAVDSKPNR